MAEMKSGRPPGDGSIGGYFSNIQPQPQLKISLEVNGIGLLCSGQYWS